MPEYTPAQFKEPKVVGLAISNAARSRERDLHDHQRQRDRNPLAEPARFPGVFCYALYVVKPDCEVRVVGGASTVSDLRQQYTNVTNLKALARQYKAIGFLIQRVDARGKVEWQDIQAGKEGAAR